MKLNKTIHFLENISCTPGYFAAGLIIPLVLATCYEVFARYVFGNPTIWAYEVGYLLMGFHFLLGGALTLKRQEHIRIDIFYNKLNDKNKAKIDLSLYLIFIVPCLFLLSIRLMDHTTNSFLNNETTGNSAWNPPIWPLHAIITISFIILFIQVIAECLKSYEKIKSLDKDKEA